MRREFEAYLKGGRLQRGFLRLRCASCHADHLLAVSCKWCGLCAGLQHLVGKAGLGCRTASTGAVTLMQRSGSAPNQNLNLHVHMLLVHGVSVEQSHSAVRFGWVLAPSGAERTALTVRIARHVDRLLQRWGLMQRDAENANLAGEATDPGPIKSLFGLSITYRIAMGLQAGRKVLTPQALPAYEQAGADSVGKVAGFVACRLGSAHRRAPQAGTAVPVFRPLGRVAAALAAHAGSYATR